MNDISAQRRVLTATSESYAEHVPHRFANFNPAVECILSDRGSANDAALFTAVFADGSGCGVALPCGKSHLFVDMGLMHVLLVTYGMYRYFNDRIRHQQQLGVIKLITA